MWFIILLFIISTLWALNMGGSGFAVSFAPSLGSKVITKIQSMALFTFFVLLGSLILGDRVANTLYTKVIPAGVIDRYVVLIILSSACLSLFLANIFKIPQSTSIITISALVGAGLYFKSLNIPFLLYLVVIWVVISILAYFLTYFITDRIYPPRFGNLELYVKFFNYNGFLTKWIIFTNCYTAFAIGTNNVANVVGPLMGADLFNPTLSFIVFSLIFGLGGGIFGKGTVDTVSREIVPLGVVTASIVSFVITNLIVLASILGLPAPYVQFSTLSILAIHTIKEEKNHIQVLDHPLISRLLKVWIITPLLSMTICYILLFMFIKRG